VPPSDTIGAVTLVAPALASDTDQLVYLGRVVEPVVALVPDTPRDRPRVAQLLAAAQRHRRGGGEQGEDGLSQASRLHCAGGSWIARVDVPLQEAWAGPFLEGHAEQVGS
jgi:hypothetical protein